MFEDVHDGEYKHLDIIKHRSHVCLLLGDPQTAGHLRSLRRGEILLALETLLQLENLFASEGCPHLLLSVTVGRCTVENVINF